MYESDLLSIRRKLDTTAHAFLQDLLGCAAQQRHSIECADESIFFNRHVINPCPVAREGDAAVAKRCGRHDLDNAGGVDLSDEKALHVAMKRSVSNILAVRRESERGDVAAIGEPRDAYLLERAAG